MTIWCSTCEERCCLICLYMNHPGCSWKPVQTEIDELQGKIEELQIRAEQNVSNNKRKLRAKQDEVRIDLQTLNSLKIAITLAEAKLGIHLAHLDIIDMKISRSTVQFTTTNDTVGQDRLLNLKDKVSALQELQFNEPDWPTLSIPADMKSVIICYRGRRASTSSVMPQAVQETVYRDPTEVITEPRILNDRLLWTSLAVLFISASESNRFV